MSEEFRLSVKPESIYIPGRGEVEIGQRAEYKAAYRAVKDYDPRLLLGRHSRTQEWVVFLEKGVDDRPYPILGLGSDLPHPDDIKKKLYQADAVRNGEEILRQINATNERVRSEYRDAADEASGQMAEGLESFLHRQGRTPYYRSLAKRDPKQRAGKD